MGRSGAGRRSIRLPGYDYRTGGAYFITICTHQRALLFGHKSHAEIVTREWARSGAMRAEIELDAFVVMPNHIHGVVILEHASLSSSARSNTRQMQPRSLGSFVRGYKSAVTVAINELRETPGMPVWQQNYYEHVIRNEADLDRVREYIENNPRRWEFDRENPRARSDAEEDAFWSSLEEARFS